MTKSLKSNLKMMISRFPAGEKTARISSFLSDNLHTFEIIY